MYLKCILSSGAWLKGYISNLDYLLPLSGFCNTITSVGNRSRIRIGTTIKMRQRSHNKTTKTMMTLRGHHHNPRAKSVADGVTGNAHTRRNTPGRSVLGTDGGSISIKRLTTRAS